MQTFFRLTLLGTFALIGVAAAVALALKLEPPKRELATSWRPQEDKPDVAAASEPSEPAKLRVADEAALPDVDTVEVAPAPVPVLPPSVQEHERVEPAEHKAPPADATHTKQPSSQVAEERPVTEPSDE